MKNCFVSYLFLLIFPFVAGAKSSFPPSFNEYSAMMKSFNTFISEMEKSPNLYYRLQHFGFGVGDDDFGNESLSVGIAFLTPKDCFGILRQRWKSIDCNEYSCESSEFDMSQCPE